MQILIFLFYKAEILDISLSYLCGFCTRRSLRSADREANVKPVRDFHNAKVCFSRDASVRARFHAS